jgi:hypothetical protein
MVKFLHRIILLIGFFCLFIEEVHKWRLLKKIHHTELVKSVEKVPKND